MAIVGKKYQKKPTIASVTQITADTAGNYGLLGVLVSGDVILQMANNALYTITGAMLSTGWDLASDNATLTGTDYL